MLALTVAVPFGPQLEVVTAMLPLGEGIESVTEAVAEHPLLSVTVTVYVPLVRLVAVAFV